MSVPSSGAQVVPVREGHSLELSWQAPPSWKEYKSGALSFISHLLGHEGERRRCLAWGWESRHFLGGGKELTKLATGPRSSAALAFGGTGEREVPRRRHGLRGKGPFQTAPGRVTEGLFQRPPLYANWLRKPSPPSCAIGLSSPPTHPHCPPPPCR